MRGRFLVALWVLVGVGLSFAQLPVTYTVPGGVMVEALANTSDVDWEILADDFDQGSVSTFYWPLSWVNGSVQYSGNIEVTNASQLVGGVLGLFYEGSCRTYVTTDCGILPVYPDSGAVTGTSLDDWYFFTAGDPGFGFPDSGVAVANCGGSGGFSTEPPGTELILYDTNGEYARYGTDYYIPAYGGGTCEPKYRLWRSFDEGVNWNDVYTYDSQTVVVEYAVSVIDGQSPRPLLAEWKTGNYVSRGGPPVAHSDAMLGLEMVFLNIWADDERSSGYLRPLVGSQFNPVPTTEQLGGVDPGDPDGDGEPGSSGGTTVDPGNCDQGWFLTKVVCEIRTVVLDTWGFISHDAWVPQEDWGTRWEAIKDDNSANIAIFTMKAVDFGIPTKSDFDARGSMDPGNHPYCNFTFSMGSIVPGQSDYQVSSVVEGATWCETAYVTWMHNTGREIIKWLLSVVFIIWVFNFVTGRT